MRGGEGGGGGEGRRSDWKRKAKGSKQGVGGWIPSTCIYQIEGVGWGWVLSFTISWQVVILGSLTFPSSSAQPPELRWSLEPALSGCRQTDRHASRSLLQHTKSLTV